MKAIRFQRPLPLLIEAENCIYDLRIEFDEGTQQWRVAAFRFGDGFVGWLTQGKDSFPELQQALTGGIEVDYDQPGAEAITMELVNEGRAAFIEAHAA